MVEPCDGGRSRSERPTSAKRARPPRRAPAPAAMIARLQQTAGNQAVTALLARQPAPIEYDTPPHEGGDAAELLKFLGPEEGNPLGDIFQNAGVLADSPTQTQAPAPRRRPTRSPTGPRRVPTTNAEYAQWVIDGVPLGFVIWSPGMGAQKQMEDLAAGKTVKGVDPTKPAILGSLKTIKTLAGARVTKWRGDETKPKDPLSVGSFLRGSGSARRPRDRHQRLRLDGRERARPGRGGAARAAGGLLRHRPAVPGPVLPEGRVARRTQEERRRPAHRHHRARRCRSSSARATRRPTRTARGRTRRPAARRSTGSRARR